MKKQIIAILSAVTIVSAAMGGVAVFKGIAETPPAAGIVAEDGKWEITGLETSPEYGKTFAIPTATVNVNGVSATAKTYVTAPDGKNYAGDKITISKSGKYTVVFSTTVDGKLYKTERTFTVDAPFISTGEKSSFEYTTYTKYDCTSENTGFLLKIAEREEVTFNKLIDFDALTKSDKLLRLFVTPKTQGTPDFDRLIMKFTDSANPDITLTVALDRVALTKWPGSDSLSYVKAAGNGQELTGVESYGSANERTHVNNEWGAGIPVSFTAMNDQNKMTIVPSFMAFDLSYDKDECILKSRGVTITDLDDAKYYKTLWKGFPSGRAKLSISASGYNSETADVMVTDVFGLDFSQTTVSDETAPKITVNTDYEQMPVAKTGREYSIPTATAIDDYSGACDVSVKVVYGYGTGNGVAVKLKDGKIVPEYAGEYAVIYEAKDGYGNVATKTYMFEAKEKIDDITAVIPEYGEFTLGDYLTVYTPTFSGGSGRIELTEKVTLNGALKEITGGKVKLDEAGKWEVSYYATDYIGNEFEKTIELSVLTPDKPVFTGTPNLPEIMIDGSGYIVPEYYAEDYSSGKCEYKLCDVIVTDSLGKKRMSGGERYVARADKDGDFVTFAYEIDGVRRAEEIRVPVIIPKRTKNGRKTLDMTKYFYGTGFTATANSTEVGIEAAENGDISWKFGNSLLAGMFSIDFHTVPDKSNFDGLKVTLTDSSDRTNSVSATLAYRKGKTYLSVNGAAIEISGGFGSFTATTIKLEYSDKIFKVGNVEIPVVTREDGIKFEGFKSDKVNLEVTASGAKKGAKYDVRAINLHKFNNNDSDYTEPAVFVSGSYGGSYDLGKTYILPAAFAGDVMSPETEIILNVYDPNGKIVRDINGRKLENADPTKEYEISLDSYGQYRVEYTATEINWWNRSKPFQYMITVYDGNAPEITFDETPKYTAKVGGTWSLPKFTVKDNVTETDKIAVGKYVYTAEGKLIKLDGNSFRFGESGKYKFRIIATDEQGNTTVKEIVVTVTD